MRGVPLAANHRRWVGRVSLALACAIALALLPTQNEPGGGAEELAAELAEVESATGEIEQANRRLRRSIGALKSDTRAIERAARDHLGMVYPDELVIRQDDAEGAP